MTEAVRVEHLTRTFGDFRAVDDVSFTVARGEIFGFLGPNGAGKTTTIKMLTGLLHPTGGSATVAGIDVARRADVLKYKIGYMSQLFSLYADLTVIENISLFCGLYGVDGARRRSRTAWVLEVAGLTGQSDRTTADLPLGWKQRLALGCAVLHEPEILFLDEPTSGVDPIARRNFWSLIDRLSDGGTTVFVSTHYLEEAEYCHRLALMNRGRLIALDTPAALRSTMTDPILSFETDEPPQAAAALLQADGVIESTMFGRSVHVVVRNETEAMGTLPVVLAAHGRTCVGLHAIQPSLEDIFVARVRAEGGAVVG